MKKVWWLFLFLLFISLALASDNLYQKEYLELSLKVKGSFQLIPETNSASLESVKVNLLFYPQDDLRQKLLTWDSTGSVEGNQVVFNWQDRTLGNKEYSFQARIRTENKRVAIDKKTLFPLSNLQSFDNYLASTEIIDKDYPDIVAKASELAEGEDDQFKVVFKLANWVNENIDYKLDSLTARASQKASWVLEHREGVCDEISSLFIAMCRSLGIPARFVSGVSYTTSSLFKENWLPHGWAEVYFPDYGWVSFDPTFDEYGYIDVTHIKLREGFDPAEASSKFEWLANQVKLSAEELNLSVEVKSQGKKSEDEISLEADVLGKEVNLDSYNLAKGSVRNKESYYLVTTLKLALPKELKIIGDEKKTLLLAPHETKEVFWLIKVDKDLRTDYEYEFPLTIYSEKNISAENRFKAVPGSISYSQEEIEKLIIQNEDKTYSQKINFNCQYKKEIKLGEEMPVNCKIKNLGNTNLNQVEFCLGKVCRRLDLPINQEEELSIKVKGQTAGWQKLLVQAVNPEIEKKTSLEYVVLDDPHIDLTLEKPDSIGYKKDFNFSLQLSKTSFSLPKNLSVILEGPRFENRWELAELKDTQRFVLDLNSGSLSSDNAFQIHLVWKDRSGQVFNQEKSFTLKVVGNSFLEKIRLWLNGMVNWLS